MSRVDFITFCHDADQFRLHAPGWLDKIISSHQYSFGQVRIIYQRCEPKYNTPYLTHKTDDHPHILSEYNLPENDQVADEFTHGPAAPHYWKWHVINHLAGLTVSTAKYVVFSDNDCLIKSSDIEYNWIMKGIEVLQTHPEVLIVSPGDGATMAEAQTPGGYRLTQNVSQQLFLCERERLKNIDFNVGWNWEFLAPGEPMQEFYYMLEGRIWRYMHHNNLWRCILPDYVARYWHCNKLTPDGYFDANFENY